MAAVAAHEDERDGDRLLSWRDLRAKIPLSRATIWALRRAGRFPEPVRISPGRVAWRESDVTSWMRQRQAGLEMA